MRVYDSFLDAVGDTPLVRLSRVARGVRPTVLAKLEMLNPGGSVKDRIGIRMIEAAERGGLLGRAARSSSRRAATPAHGLAIAAAIKGYRCIFVMPDKMSAEKVALLRAYGAEVVITPTAVPPESPESLLPRRRPADRGDPRRVPAQPVLQSGEPAGALRDDRPGDLGETEGRIDVLVAGVGTGGTITGVGAVPEGTEAVARRGGRGPRGLAAVRRRRPGRT